ncbi:large conductance mechanosensitive channel protein MscL [Acidipropionibacterium jensenii]|uniref:Large conductance mechanosensitive channel protein MscL n=1 Tax=Acidipropionibacterium jensenii TaxID=1749 RepID=A0A3T0S0Y5_9ACTN|nr:large conductance mechanosensitive channel protein MscL [Acidipropionibacterium jensenii]AZZ40027.1 large conductance mechanosensitive channel protein MscL [Acidipropionibacterium jensenii]MDN5978057.1 large conductance mechanosensitive channel protein MscL [Acidipropionibacterium jensenii]MDN5996527.1 large conductance mechanosensitive channel protein MscL [Acidipropionibacterium jensenii]MDN6426444.1 large conductance mechanosensitive channel protein MscL [Acidipropionibacterium jensenii]
MKGFKDFIMRGNLVELAVAFILGAAFGDVVKSFTAIIMDLIGKLGGTPNFSTFVPWGIHIGAFLTAVVAFLILAFVIYFGLVKPFEYAKSKLVTDDPDDVPPTTEELLADIRDLLAAKNGSN